MTPVNLQLYRLCLEAINKRIAAANQALREAQASSNEETKSSSGDKHETGRAMSQLEVEKNAAQLAGALKLRETLEGIAGKNPTETARAGSVVITNQGNFYLAIPAGEWMIDDKTYFSISVASPMGKMLHGLRAGSAFQFRGKNYLVERVF